MSQQFEAVEILILSVTLYLLVTPVAATVCQEIYNKPMHILKVYFCALQVTAAFHFGIIRAAAVRVMAC